MMRNHAAVEGDVGIRGLHADRHIGPHSGHTRCKFLMGVIPAVPAFVQMAGSGAASNFSCARAVPGTRMSAAAKRVWIGFIRKLLSFMMTVLGVIEMCGSVHHSQHCWTARSHKAPHQQGG